MCRDLIRIDTTNTGDNDTSAGERVAAEYVAEKLAEVGLEPVIRESAPGRTSVFAGFRARAVRASRPGAPCWCTATWTWCPRTRTSGRCIRSPVRCADGYLWGRGAVDMKDFDAMVLAAVAADAPGGPHPAAGPGAGVHRRRGGRRRVRRALAGRQPRRAVRRRVPRRSARSAASPYTVSDDLRLYLIETAEKGMTWLRLQAEGPTRPRLDDPRRQRGDRARRGGGPGRPAPVPGRRVTDTVRAFLDRALRRTRHRARPGRPGDGPIAKLGPHRPHHRRDASATPPIRPGSTAGYKDNVIPGRATATIDCRTLPGPARELPGAAARGGRARPASSR